MTFQNSKFIFLFFSLFFLSGCVQNVDLRHQAEENKAREQENKTPVAEIEKSSVKNPETENKAPIKILFVGDMMFDRHIREAVQKYGGGDYSYILEPVKEYLSQFDLVVGNLEGPITNKESVSVNTKMGEGKNFVFTFDPSVAKVLAENNIKMVNLGNNHILNQGKGGVEQTKKYLDEAGVKYFGDADYLETKFPNGSLVSFIGYNYSESGSEEKAIEEIKKAKQQSDVVIVCPHWGTEYKVGDPGESIRSLAHRFIEAGADVIIGTHPHVIQMNEEYKGKKIYYSLGNFVFDQYFQSETMEGLGVEMTIKPDSSTLLGTSLEYKEINFKMTKKGQTVFKVEP